MLYQLWQRSRWFAPSCIVTEVTKARPRWVRKALMSASARLKVFRTYWFVAELQTTAVSEVTRLLSEPYVVPEIWVSLLAGAPAPWASMARAPPMVMSPGAGTDTQP